MALVVEIPPDSPSASVRVLSASSSPLPSPELKPVQRVPGPAFTFDLGDESVVIRYWRCVCGRGWRDTCLSRSLDRFSDCGPLGRVSSRLCGACRGCAQCLAVAAPAGDARD